MDLSSLSVSSATPLPDDGEIVLKRRLDAYYLQLQVTGSGNLHRFDANQ